jgi:hypothetical protein
MKITSVAIGAALTLGVSLPAQAGPVTATLSATYYEVPNDVASGPDFGGSGTPARILAFTGYPMLILPPRCFPPARIR